MLTELSALLDLLKAKGVNHLRLEPFDAKGIMGASIIDVTFAASLVMVDPVERRDEKPFELVPDAKMPDPDVCSCGHGVHEHNNGLCLVGCDEGKCNVTA